MVWWWYVAGAIPGVSLAATILMGRKISDLEKNNRELAEQLQSEKDRRERFLDKFGRQRATYLNRIVRFQSPLLTKI